MLDPAAATFEAAGALAPAAAIELAVAVPPLPPLVFPVFPWRAAATMAGKRIVAYFMMKIVKYDPDQKIVKTAQQYSLIEGM